MPDSLRRHCVRDVRERLPHGPGGQGVAGSNPVSPTVTSQVRASIRRIGLRPLICFGANSRPPIGPQSHQRDLWLPVLSARDLRHRGDNAPEGHLLKGQGGSERGRVLRSGCSERHNTGELARS
jgi:hypothetical protein